MTFKKPPCGLSFYLIIYPIKYVQIEVGSIGRINAVFLQVQPL